MMRNWLEKGSYLLGAIILAASGYVLFCYYSEIAATQHDQWTGYRTFEAFVNIGPELIVGLSCLLGPLLHKYPVAEKINYTVGCLIAIYVLIALTATPKGLFTWLLLTMVVLIVAVRSLAVFGRTAE